jgi:hypothetical protein
VNPRLARFLVRLYPHEWRLRYGDEFEALLLSDRGGIRTYANIIRAALCEHVFPTSRLRVAMNPYPTSVIALSKLPSAFMPMAMSLTALTFVLGSIAIFGVVHETDEGTVAHLWQILMVGQIPILAFFVIKWMPRTPKQTLGVIAVQLGAALASMAPVLLLGL